jgi:Flp pilus assembly protein TadG
MRHIRKLVSRFGPGSRLTLLAEERGTGLLEYALVVLLFMTMLFGVAEFGHVLYAYHFVSNAAKQATRYAAVHGSTCNDDGSCSVADPDTGPAAPGNTVIQDYVAATTPPGIDSSSVAGCGGSAVLNVCATWPIQSTCTTQSPPTPSGCSPVICSTTANAPGCTVQVTVSYNFNFIFPLIRKTALPLSSTSQMVIAH